MYVRVEKWQSLCKLFTSPGQRCKKENLLFSRGLLLGMLSHSSPLVFLPKPSASMSSDMGTFLQFSFVFSRGDYLLAREKNMKLAGN